ncbi:MAG: MFS transporter [Patescibacteria group bacterium]|nr:MFS transporter [Patescibacteria group bacterium]
MDKKKLFYWCLYDFANSIIFINFLLYFSQWMVIEGGLSDFWYNAIFAITSIMLFLSAPTLAAFTDRHGGRKYLLNFATIGTFLGYGFATVFAYLGTQYIFAIAGCFLIGQYFYQLAFVFYNTLIEDVADIGHRARASGIGQFSNSLGQVIGLVIAIPLSATRLQPLFPSLIIFVLLALPMMIFFKDSRPKGRVIDTRVLVDGEKEYLKKMIGFFSISIAVPMLVSFFFFNDALITVSNNYPIYMERVFAVPDTIKNILLMAILLMSAIGGLVSGRIADKIGALKTLKFILIGWIILVPLIALSNGLVWLSIFSILVGSLIGSAWTVTRAYLSELLKKEELGYGFSFYTLAERFATLLGPLTWGGIIAGLGIQHTSYRIAMASMALFVVVGLIILIKWKRVPKVQAV